MLALANGGARYVQGALNFSEYSRVLSFYKVFLSATAASTVFYDPMPKHLYLDMLSNCRPKKGAERS